MPDHYLRAQQHADRKFSGLLSVFYGWSAITALFLSALGAFLVYGGLLYVVAVIFAIAAYGFAYYAQVIDAFMANINIPNRDVWAKKFQLFQISSIVAATFSGILLLIATIV